MPSVELRQKNSADHHDAAITRQSEVSDDDDWGEFDAEDNAQSEETFGWDDYPIAAPKHNALYSGDSDILFRSSGSTTASELYTTAQTRLLLGFLPPLDGSTAGHHTPTLSECTKYAISNP